MLLDFLKISSLYCHDQITIQDLYEPSVGTFKKQPGKCFELDINLGTTSLITSVIGNFFFDVCVISSYLLLRFQIETIK